MNSRLKEILKFMQRIDPNGNWEDAEQDIKDGITTLKDVIEGIKGTLEDWEQECSIEQAELIREYLKEVKEL